MQSISVLTYVFSIISAVIVSGIGAFLIRRKTASEVSLNLANVEKTKAETEKFVVDTMRDTLNELRQEREADRKEIEENRKTIRAAIQANDDCEFEHGITRLQLNKVLRKIDMEHWIKSTVFVLDDNKMVTDVFLHRFRTIPVVNFKAYTNSDAFLQDAQRERPEIVVIDHELGEKRTARNIIELFGYTPEIIVMSGTRENQIFYEGTDVKFFYKDSFYIRNITRTILEHLISKNK